MIVLSVNGLHDSVFQSGWTGRHPKHTGTQSLKNLFCCMQLSDVQ